MKHHVHRFKTLRQIFLKGIFYSSMFIIAILNSNCDSNKTKLWISYRHDNARSGVTSTDLKPPLSLQWIFKPAHPPRVAWPKPGEELARMHFDNAHHVTVAHGMVYFGSSVDNKVYALAEQSGAIKWTFFTEGPVRFAPTIWKDRVYAGSDDGLVYCLQARSGRLIWKYRPGPTGEKVLGNGRMISMWPVRTGVLVDDGIVYVAAGVFPYEGIYICALDADNGSVIWKNDTIGDRAHELTFNGISPHGYLLTSENVLYVPSGRAIPAAFNKKTGEFLYYPRPDTKTGGTWSLLSDDRLITGVDFSGTPAKAAYDEQTGQKVDDVHAWFPGIELIVTPDISYALTQNGIIAMNRADFQAALEKMRVINFDRDGITSRLKDLNKKIDAATENRDELLRQRHDISQKLAELGENEKKLKESVLLWEFSAKNLHSFILTDTTLFAGGDSMVIAVSSHTGSKLWQEAIAGTVFGLAVANGLYVSTDNGDIYCFGAGQLPEAKQIEANRVSAPFPTDELTPIYIAAAEQILTATHIDKGYCLVLDSGTGRLACELAKRSELKIIGIEEKQQKVQEAKLKLDAAGLYGSRVVVEQWELSDLPDYFANLVVVDGTLFSGSINCSPGAIFRVLKPYGGVGYLGQPSEAGMTGTPLAPDTLRRWLQPMAADVEIVQDDGVWAKITRGGLEGAGSWTEQYGNHENTACSGDQLVQGPLGVLWFGEPGSEKMLDRHGKAASPVAMDGRLFIQGEEVIMAYDVFNGTCLWERKMPGAVRARADADGGNLALCAEALYVAAHDKCYSLDPATGATKAIFELPATPDGRVHRWTWVSSYDNILYGAMGKPLNRDYFSFYDLAMAHGRWKENDAIPVEYRADFAEMKARYPVPDERLAADLKRSGALWRLMADYPVWELYKPARDAVTDKMMTSDGIFAMDPATGKVLWHHQGHQIAHITIAKGDGIIFFAERKISEQQKQRAIADRNKHGQAGIFEPAPGEEIPNSDIDARLVLALDATTGKKLWDRTVDLTGCGGDGMGAAYHNGVLLFFGNTGTHDAWRFQQGQLKWRRITALDGKSGVMLWSKPLNYNTRPVVVGNQIIIEPRICDLHTGQIRMRNHPISGQSVPFEFLRPGHTCAISSASANMLFYRSYSAAMFDFTDDQGLVLFGGIRPGCWINMIPASGVLLWPEASAGCTCSFPLRCSVVLTRKQNRSQPYSVFICHGPLTPARHFAINLGAPADMKDDDGTVWFGYPNPNTDYKGIHYPDYGLKFNLNEVTLPGMGYFSRDVKGVTIKGSNKPFLFTSGCVGLTKCEVPLVDDLFDEEPAVYTIRLGFSAPAGDRKGQRVFAVKLQGKTVLAQLDILNEAGSPNTALIKEFKGIQVHNVLKVELTPQKASPTMAQAPIINFIEIINENVAETLESRVPEPMTTSAAEFMLITAAGELEANRMENALEKFHHVLEAAPSDDLKQRALMGMAGIGSVKSLNKIEKYCRPDDPILWNYKEPDPGLKDSAMKVFIAIANNLATVDAQKAIRMLQYALAQASADVRAEIVVRLKRLGVEVDKKVEL